MLKVLHNVLTVSSSKGTAKQSRKFHTLNTVVCDTVACSIIT